MAYIKGKVSGDYFVILCDECNSHVNIKYLGWDPVAAHIEVTCEKCNTSNTWKLSDPHWEGLPPEPYDTE